MATVVACERLRFHRVGHERRRERNDEFFFPLNRETKPAPEVLGVLEHQHSAIVYVRWEPSTCSPAPLMLSLTLRERIAAELLALTCSQSRDTVAVEL